MNVNSLPPPARIEALARRAGVERSLYLGEMIGEGLAISWAALKAAGHWVVYSTLRVRHS